MQWCQKSVTSCFAKEWYKCILLFWCLYCCCSCCCYILSILIWRGTVSWHMEKCVYKFVYSETTGYYENVPVLLRGTFYTYSVSANKNHEHFVIWKLSEANIIIFSLNYFCVLNRLLKIFCSFLFLPFKGSQEFAFRRVQCCQFMWFF